MPRYAQLVMGPAGSGKSTYCSTIVKHCEVLRRTVNVVNLDPAAEHFDYPVLVDIQDLISLSDVTEDEDLRFGPNGGLIFCMEHFAQNFDWLKEQLDEDEDDYILFDCPGQIELYTHIPVMRQLVDQLKSWNFYVCGVFLLDAQFMIDAGKFVSGVMSALSAMVTLEIPHVNVLNKLDLLNKKGKKDLERFLDPDLPQIVSDDLNQSQFGKKYKNLNHAVAQLVDDFSLVRFLPLDITDDESLNDILLQIDLAIQYGDDLEPKEPKDFEEQEHMDDKSQDLHYDHNS